MKICCLDQSTKITGYSVWNNRRLTGHGCIDFSDVRDREERMIRMYRAVKKLVQKEKPDFVVFEDVQFQTNQQVYKVLSQLQGVIMAVTYELGCGFIIVEPLVWKSYVGIKSRKRDDQKRETQETVKKKYKLPEVGEDEADALAIGMWAVDNLISE